MYVLITKDFKHILRNINNAPLVNGKREFILFHTQFYKQKYPVIAKANVCMCMLKGNKNSFICVFYHVCMQVYMFPFCKLHVLHNFKYLLHTLQQNININNNNKKILLFTYVYTIYVCKCYTY